MRGDSLQYYEFGPFRFDPAERELTRDGKTVSLTPKASQALLLLLQNHGRLVTKETLVETVWPNTFVEDSTLSQNIFTLRKALGEGGDGRPYIETATRRGYKFVGAVREVREDSSDAAKTEAATATPAAADTVITDGAKPEISLAALPLINNSSNPNAEYLAYGIPETIISSLSQIPQLRVMASSTVFHFREPNADAQEIGRKLGVGAVLVGKIFQLKDRLIVRMELVDVAHGWQIWGKHYNREASDILEIEEDIANEVSKSLELRLTGAQQKQLHNRYFSENAEAHQFYLRGRYYWNKHNRKDYEQSIEYYKLAVEIDPNYALAYSGLADSYVRLDFYGVREPSELMSEAKAAALRAVQLDGVLAETHTSLASVKLIYDRDWDEAESSFKKAIRLNPKYSPAHQWYSHYLLAIGRTDESLKESKLAVELDPLDPYSNLQLGWHYLYTRRFEEAVIQLRRTLDIDPNFWAAHVLLAETYGRQGSYSEALGVLSGIRHLEDVPISQGLLGCLHARNGDEEAARQVLDELKEQMKQNYIPPYGLALIYTGLDEKDQAFEWLEKACEVRNEWVCWMKVNPEFDNLRVDPRYPELLQRIGLPNP